MATVTRGKVLSAKTLAAISAGGTSGLGLLVSHVAFATLIFSGALAPYSSQGIGFVLFGCFSGCLIIALIGGFRGAIAGLSPALVVAMVHIAGSMQVSTESLFVTTIVSLAIGAAATGALCYFVGKYELTYLVRFIPFPVASGFVGGIGGVVCLTAIAVAGVDLNWRTLPRLFDSSVLIQWVPGVIFGLGLYLTLKRWRNPLILPISVVIFVGVYQVAFMALGISDTQVKELQLLYTSTVAGNLWPPVMPNELLGTDWSAILSQLPNLLALTLVALICIVMALSGLEVALNEDLEWDSEFRAAGTASVFGGIGGGTFICMIVPASFRSKQFGATSRLTGVVCALVIAGALFFGDAALEFIPISLLIGILLFAGVGMIDEGLIRTYRRLPWAEFSIVLTIVIVIIVLGLLQGIAVGILATLVFFTLRLSRVDPVASRFLAQTQSSKVVRTPPDRAILREHGTQIIGFRLRGYLFFGSAFSLADRLRRAIDDETTPSFLILDFTNVSGFDYSAVNVLGRFVQNAGKNSIRIVLSGASQAFIEGMSRNLPSVSFDDLIVTANEDTALELCEDEVIDAWRTSSRDAREERGELLQKSAEEIERYLDKQIVFEELLARLETLTHQLDVAEGEGITSNDEEEIQFLVQGRATAYNKNGERLLQCQIGDIIAPRAAVHSNAATIIADEPLKVVRVSRANLRSIEQEKPDIALSLYRYLHVIRQLSTDSLRSLGTRLS